MKETDRLHAFTRADQLVLALGALFLLLLVGKVYFPTSHVWGLLFYTTEAALVGGIADWFAVSALFTKPLGIKYHTNLLLRSKEQLARGCGEMVQRDLLDMGTLEQKLKEAHLTELLLTHLEDPALRQKIIGVLLDYGEGKLKQLDTKSLAKSIAAIVRKKVAEYDIPEQLALYLQGKLAAGYDNELYDKLLLVLKEKVSTEETKKYIRKQVIQYINAYEEKHKVASAAVRLWDMLANGVFDAKRIIDEDEITQELYEQLPKALDELKEYAPLRSLCITQLNATLTGATTSPEWRGILHSLQQAILKQIKLKSTIEGILRRLVAALVRPEGVSGSELQETTLLCRIISGSVDMLYDCLKRDGAERQQIEEFLHRLATYALTAGHAIIGEITERVLSTMDDDKLNNLIYSKVEEDMLWIRYNGSLIGAILGVVSYGIWLVAG